MFVVVDVKPEFILVSAIINREYIKEKYIGYTAEEAKHKFKSKYKNHEKRINTHNH